MAGVTAKRNVSQGRPSSSGPSAPEKLFIFITVVFCCLSIGLNVLHQKEVSGDGLATMKHPILTKFKEKRLGESIKHKLNPKKNSKANKKKPGIRNNKRISPTIKNGISEQGEDDAAKKKTRMRNNKPYAPPIKNGISEQEKDDAAKAQEESEHSLGGLKCAAYGGPEDEIAIKEMVYWSDIPSDSEYVSPFKRNNEAKGGPVQYMTFEPDGGGWNNIRMAMETVVVLAHAMGRTLVMPPAQGMYLLRKDRGKQNTDFSFADFFHLESLSNEHAGLDIITTEEFLEREAMTGNLRNKTTGEVAFPPGNRTNWNGQDLKPYKAYMRDVIYTPLWSPGNCLAAFPASGDTKDITDLHEMLETIKKEGHIDTTKYINNPTPVDGSPIDRMRENLAARNHLCVYDEEMQNEPVLHFMCYHKMHVRLLTHFYSFLFFEDWKQQLWEHRFVRDHLRYLDELQCTAARVVTEIRRLSKEKVENNPNGDFDTVHIRRGDFQYKDTRLEADELYKLSKDVLHADGVLYIATDERNKKFFDPFRAHYKIYFLDDFKYLVSHRISLGIDYNVFIVSEFFTNIIV